LGEAPPAPDALLNGDSAAKYKLIKSTARLHEQAVPDARERILHEVEKIGNVLPACETEGRGTGWDGPEGNPLHAMYRFARRAVKRELHMVGLGLRHSGRVMAELRRAEAPEGQAREVMEVMEAAASLPSPEGLSATTLLRLMDAVAGALRAGLTDPTEVRVAWELGCVGAAMARA